VSFSPSLSLSVNRTIALLLSLFLAPSLLLVLFLAVSLSHHLAFLVSLSLSLAFSLGHTYTRTRAALVRLLTFSFLHPRAHTRMLSLSQSELKAAMQAMGIFKSKADVEKLFAESDSDGNGTIEVDEVSPPSSSF